MVLERLVARKKRELEIDPQQPAGKPAEEPRKNDLRDDSRTASAPSPAHTPEANSEENGEPHESGEPEKTFPRCPNCGWRNVRLSHINGPVDSVMKMFSIMPFRCRSCGTRFRRRWIVRGTKEEA